MTEKCIILCADHRCKHNCPGHYYGTCQHPDHANLGVYGGITRMYMETCPRNEPLPPKMVIMGSMPRIIHGCAGSGKSPLTPYLNASTELLEQGIVPFTEILDDKFYFTENDVRSAIEQFQHLKPADRCVYLMGKWNCQKKED